jgi:predicted phage terminase large subunit-like protein
VTRAAPATAVMAGGRLYTPAHAPWLSDVLPELLAFPAAAHDDQLDALAYGVQVLLEALAAASVHCARQQAAGDRFVGQA